jgi:hypothetical protein
MKKILASLSTLGLSVVSTTGIVLAMPTKTAPATGTKLNIEMGSGYVNDLGTVISGAINLIFMVAALIAFGFLIFGGIEWITSGGDKSKTEGARNKITAAVVGLLILAASWAIINFTLSLLGFDGGIKDVLKNVPSLKGTKP